MGIQGLLPYLKKASRPTNIREFKGCTAAVDSYCWLHRGAFACAEKLAVGEKTDQYVYYCMKYVNYMLSVGVKPIMVFDGCHLPSKKDVEESRRGRRETYRKKAAQFLREGRRSEARDCLTKCIDITPQMALELMNACRLKGVDCIVAPYEADAQLAYLNKIGIADIIISEDSDLILFGCEKVIFKMDNLGNGVLVESRHLNVAMDLRPDVYTFDKFRYMCILSGCDYLPSLPGIGLGKATKVFKLSRQSDISVILKKLPSILNMANLVVPDEYIAGFHRANNTFLYQLVYDPLMRKLVPLTPYPPEINPDDLVYAGPYLDPEKALQIALGNVDIHTGKMIGNFNPDKPKSQRSNNTQNSPASHQLSIWSRNYCPATKSFQNKDKEVKWPTTKGHEVTVSLPKTIRKSKALKRPLAEEDESEQDLFSAYQNPEMNTQTPKCRKVSDNYVDLDCAGTGTEYQSITSSTDKNKADQFELTDNDVKCEKSSPVKSPVNNVFAVHDLKLKREKFSLDTEKKPEVITEVKSRFFRKREPLLPSNFFDELNRSHDHSENNEHSESDTGESRLKSANDDSPVSEHITKLKSQNETPSSPYGSFGFGRKSRKALLDSAFDRSSPSVKNGFKPVKPRMGNASSSKSTDEIVFGENDSGRSSWQSGCVDFCKPDPEVSDDSGKLTTLQSSTLYDSESRSVSSEESGLEASRFQAKQLNTEDSGQEILTNCEDDTVPNGSVVTSELDNSCQNLLLRAGGATVGVRTSGLSKVSKKQTQETKEKCSSKKQQPSISNFFSKYAFNKR